LCRRDPNFFHLRPVPPVNAFPTADFDLMGSDHRPNAAFLVIS